MRQTKRLLVPSSAPPRYRCLFDAHSSEGLEERLATLQTHCVSPEQPELPPALEHKKALSKLRMWALRRGAIIRAYQPSKGEPLDETLEFLLREFHGRLSDATGQLASGAVLDALRELGLSAATVGGDEEAPKGLFASILPSVPPLASHAAQSLTLAQFGGLVRRKLAELGVIKASHTPSASHTTNTGGASPQRASDVKFYTPRHRRRSTGGPNPSTKSAELNFSMLAATPPHSPRHASAVTFHTLPKA